MRASCVIDDVYVLKAAVLRYLERREFTLVSQTIVRCFTEWCVHQIHCFTVWSDSSLLEDCPFFVYFLWLEGNHNHAVTSSEVR